MKEVYSKSFEAEGVQFQITVDRSKSQKERSPNGDTINYVEVISDSDYKVTHESRSNHFAEIVTLEDTIAKAESEALIWAKKRNLKDPLREALTSNGFTSFFESDLTFESKTD